MAALGTRFGKRLLGLGLGIGVGGFVMTPPAFAQNTPLDPYGPPTGSYAPAPQVIAPVPPPPPIVQTPPSSSGQSGGITNNNTNTVDPVITANPTNTATNNANNTNENKNDNRSSATNNNTIYIYPPTYTPPVPSASAPVVAQPSILPPPLVPPPMLPQYSPTSPYFRPQRIRLNCQRLCQRAPQPISPALPAWRRQLERARFVSLGGHFTVMGMDHQPIAGWGTLYGGGISLSFRSRGRFGFEMSQDFLRGSMGNVGGSSFERKSYPFEFTLKGYIMPNSDRHHFNMYFGGGLGAMASNVSVPLGSGQVDHQDFLEWMVHGDVGAELRFKWLALGVDGRIDALYRDRSYGAGALYGGIKDAPVPASTWGAEGRAYLNFWF